MIDFAAAVPVAGDLDVRWSHGARGEPPIQVHAYDLHTYLLRQSKATSYEAPFIYLIFGNERAILLDTGATKDPAVFPLRSTVDRLIADWLAANPREDYELVVAHTHGHGDHVAGDGQFDGRPLTTVVSPAVEAVRQFYGFNDWPAEVVSFDLGGRVLELTGIPGHQPAAIAIYDPWTGFLLTGDTVYPGRLYALDFPAFVEGLERLADFAAARQITHVMGCHIEMTRTPGRDYPLGALYQPDEPPLQMTVAQLVAVRDAARSVTARPGAHTFDDFIIFNGPSRAAVVRQLARSAWRRLTRQDAP
ncbi:MAG TPA: MBL fold metallo-hydrolase [Streptosporangiaceae bacterium]|nr:MBL fold metallo-hydrolase [Streptosporangiaceae bacterium]